MLQFGFLSRKFVFMINGKYCFCKRRQFCFVNAIDAGEDLSATAAP